MREIRKIWKKFDQSGIGTIMFYEIDDFLNCKLVTRTRFRAGNQVEKTSVVISQEDQQGSGFLPGPWSDGGSPKDDGHARRRKGVRVQSSIHQSTCGRHSAGTRSRRARSSGSLSREYCSASSNWQKGWRSGWANPVKCHLHFLRDACWCQKKLMSLSVV